MGQNFDDFPGFQQIPGMPMPIEGSVDCLLEFRRLLLF
jgi:hypothetical protein